jgi:ParB family chromosome partitioning protein
MAPRSGLGKGLDALIPSSQPAQSVEGESGVLHVPVELILRNPRQPRSQFDSKALEELAASVRENGIIQPLILTPAAEDKKYTLIAGERRAGRFAHRAGNPSTSRRSGFAGIGSN